MELAAVPEEPPEELEVLDPCEAELHPASKHCHGNNDSSDCCEDPSFHSRS